MQVKAEEFPMFCQANAGLFTQVMSCCFSLCVTLKKKKKWNTQHTIYKYLVAYNVPLAGYSIIWAAEELWNLINIRGEGLIAVLLMGSSAVPGCPVAVLKGHPSEWVRSSRNVFSPVILTGPGPTGPPPARDGCDIYGPDYMSFIKRQLLGLCWGLRASGTVAVTSAAEVCELMIRWIQQVVQH